MKRKTKQIERKKLHYLPVAAIDAYTNSVRQFFDVEKLKEMAASIKEKGVLQSIVVRPKKGKPNRFEVVIGMRRFKSALLANKKEIPCVIEEVDDKEALELALTENIQREDLTPFEEGLGIVKLMKEYGYSIEKVCQKFGKSNDFVRTRIKLLSLPEEIQKYVVRGELGMEHAAALVGIDPAKQKKLAGEIIAGFLSRDQAKELVLQETKKTKPEAKRLRTEIPIRKIELQVEALSGLLTDLDCNKLSLPKMESLKIVLSELRKLIDKIIQEIERAD